MKPSLFRMIFCLTLVISLLRGYSQVPYSSHSVFTTGLNVPNQIVFDSAGNLYVANHTYASYAGIYSNTIAKVDTAGNKSIFIAGYTWPSSVAVDQQQNIYFTQNNASNNITKADPNGIPVTYAGLPHSPGSITLFQSGSSISIYTISHWGAKGIYRTTGLNTFTLFDAGGYLGNQISATGQYLFAWSADTLYRFDTSSANKQNWVSKIQSYEPWGHALGPDSNLYLIGKSLCDSGFKALFRINGYENITEVITKLPLTSEFNGIAFKSLSGNQYEIYLSEVVNGNRADPSSNRIIRFLMPSTSQAATFPANLLANDTTICQAIPLFINLATKFQSVLWSTNDTTLSITAGYPGTYAILAIDSAGCHYADSINLWPCAANPGPILSDTLICRGDSLLLQAPQTNYSANYFWSNNATTPSITVAPLQTTTYSVIVTNGIDTIFDTCTVYVAFAIAGPSDTICLGDTTQLGAISGAPNYLWTPAASLSNSGIANPMAFPLQNTTYQLSSYWQLQGFSKTCTDSVTITVIAPPTISLGNDTSICQGAPVNLNPGAGFSSYLWSTNATTPSIAVTQSGLYWVEVTNSFNCKSSDTILVTINPYPAIVITAAADTLCLGDQTTIIATSSIPLATYAWSTGALIDSIVVTPATISTYLVTVTHQGCNSVDSVTIHVKPMPVPHISANKYTLCHGDSAVVQVSTLYTGTTYQWSTGQTAQMITVTPGISTTYFVTATLNGCVADTNITIEVNPIPQITLTTTNNLVCEGDTSSLMAASNIWGTQFTWSTGQSGPKITIKPTFPTTTTVTATVNGCSNTDSITIFTKPIPDVHLTMSDDTICAGETVVLSASSSLAGVTFLWSTGGFTPQISVSPQTTSAYWVISTINGCLSDTLAFVEVYPSPVLTIDPDPVEICIGETVTIDVTSDMPGTTFQWSNGFTTPSISFVPNASTTLILTATAMDCDRVAHINITVNPLPTISLGKDGYICDNETVTLNPTGTYSSLLWWDGSSTPQHTIYEPGTYWVTANHLNCLNADTVIYEKCSSIIVPNVFTPNGDGINDFFKPKFETMEIRSLHIYSRWGALVYYTDDLTSGWDGTNHGMPCAEGVYYYVIRYFNPMVNVVQDKGGAVQLLR